MALARSAGRRYLCRALVEALHLAAGVHDPLLAGEEGMAGGADLRLQLPPDRAGGEGVAADAGDDRVLVEGGMDLGSHFFFFLGYRTLDSSLVAEPVDHRGQQLLGGD